MERLNKYIAQSGACSRREADECIRKGEVTVNYEVQKNFSTMVGDNDEVRLNKKLLEQKPVQVMAFHKPTDVICTREDEHGRRTIFDLLPPKLSYLSYVGRLDRNSEGLLILTNDGDLAQQLVHPRFKVEKEYLVTVHQSINDEALNALLRGVFTKEGKLQAKAVARVSPRRIRIVLEQGVKRQIRVMLETLGYMVKKLLRIRVGSFWIDEIQPGKGVFLTPADIDLLLVNPPMDKKFFTKAKESSKGKKAKKSTRRRPKNRR